MADSFYYAGIIPASKSHFNRALICASYADSAVTLQGDSNSDDVQKMQEALSNLYKNSSFDCGSAGTVLRFLALRVSRIPGVHILKGSSRLLSRPQEDLAAVFEQLGVRVHFQPEQIIIESQGWKLKNSTLKVNREKSSQFISGVLLNAWNLNFPLTIEWDKPGVSEGYWQMSTQVVQNFGMKLQQNNLGVTIPAHSKININTYAVESDLSSAFAIAAYAALNGQATFKNFPTHSLQPDKVFLEILKNMGVGIEFKENEVRVFKKSSLNGIHCNLNSCPDLFPVLATLCAFAKGPSRLDGAPHLVFKESNRIQKTAELLHHMNVKTKILPDGMEINPPAELAIPLTNFSYDTDHDHRLAFATALLASKHYPIQILHPEVVTKSFPEFWDIVGHKSSAISKKNMVK